MVRNEQVAAAWINGQAAESGRMHTDGKSIWSYGLRVGHIAPIAQGPIYIRKAARFLGGKVYSMTTSVHMRRVIDAADNAAQKYGYVVRLIDDAEFDGVASKHGG